MRTNKKTALLLMLVAILLFQNCSNSDPAPGTSEDTEYFGTQNPGDAWTTFLLNSSSQFLMTWDHGTSLTTADDVILKGPFAKLANGYIKMTITSVVPATTGIPTDGSMIFYAVEIPGKSMFIMPPSASKLGLITMNARGTRTGTNGSTKFNYIRTAFPSKGYQHVTVDECWGVMDFNFNEAAGTFSFGSQTVAKTLSCAEHDINAAVACQEQNPGTTPVGVTIGTINTLGTLEQTTNIDNKKFTGQFTVSDGLLVMDNGEGSGGFIGIKQDATSTISQFLGLQYGGFGSFFGRNEKNDFFLTQSGAKLNTFAPDSAAITYYSDIATDNLQNHTSFGVKFKSMDKGIIKGYLWALDSDSQPLGSKYPFVATTYTKNNKKMIIMLSGQETVYPTATRGEQWLFEFVSNQ